ncbi:DUF3570 domain-containing protein [Peristeroidobacter agariperforans]|uniref:DUF3570 domain-containing protein n=1 Tax=Peristeroidobacter agariperforans TaxID=268404 RepID=UPI00101E1A2A|nr:DUF3570 domain-containing protein [Peristeroidobacter agariperforans]
MNDDNNLSATLAAATCALLGASAAGPVMAGETDRWSFDTALLYYAESDDRVQDVSATIGAQRAFEDDRLLNLTLTADTLTGASASGAIASDLPQTFTSPSGRAVYSTPAGETPLDDTFLDTRFALNASWTQPLARLYTVSAGLGFSTEYDYTHLGANVSLARDFNKRNTTVSAGLAYSQDDIDPVGGAPVPLSQMLDVGDGSNKLSSDSKDVLDVLLGLTQVLSRNTVLRVNYSYSQSSGYLNDPYKILSVVDGTTGDTILRTPAPGVAGPTGIYLYESRPDSRAKHSLYAEVKHAFGAPVLYGSYRFMTDDWGIDSHTGEVRLRWPVGDASYVEPQLRYYMQSQADFYHPSLVQGAALPAYASADFRLGEFDAVTVGLKFGHRTSGGNEWNARLEYYQQNGSISRDQLIGNQFAREQYPDLKAVIAQFGYRFGL